MSSSQFMGHLASSLLQCGEVSAQLHHIAHMPCWLDLIKHTRTHTHTPKSYQMHVLRSYIAVAWPLKDMPHTHPILTCSVAELQMVAFHYSSLTAFLPASNLLLGMHRVVEIIHEADHWIIRAAIYFCGGTIGFTVIVMAAFNLYHIIYLKRTALLPTSMTCLQLHSMHLGLDRLPPL